MSDWNVQVAVYEALVAANVCDGNIKAPAPQGYSVFPYVDIGESDALPLDTSGSEAATKAGADEIIRLHVWSRGSSMKEPKQIISAIHAALHDKALSVTGQTRAWSLIRSSEIDRDPDGETFHGVVEVRILYHS